MDQSGCTPLHHACINAPDGHKSVKVLPLTVSAMPNLLIYIFKEAGFDDNLLKHNLLINYFT